MLYTKSQERQKTLYCCRSIKKTLQKYTLFAAHSLLIQYYNNNKTFDWNEKHIKKD